MDIESDDSERWEDFFGSSTELAPSLLGIYDTLTSTLDASFNSDSNNNNNNNNNSNSSTNNNSSNNTASHNSSSGHGHSHSHASNELHNGGGNISDTSTISNKGSRHSSCSSDGKLSGEYTLPHDSNNNNNSSSSNTNNEHRDSSSGYRSACADKQNDALVALPTVPQSAALLQQKLSIEETDACEGGSLSSGRNSSPACSQSNLSSLSPTSQKSNSSLSSNSSNSNNASQRSREPTPGSCSSKHRNNIRVLSANVQRIITHSDAEPVDSVDIDALQPQPPPCHLQSPVLSPVLSHRIYNKKPATPITSTPFFHKVKLSCIPLSKVTGKLTQSGNELVETFDSSSEYLDALNFAQTEKKRFVKKPPTPAVVSIPGSCVDGEKTPTNAGSAARLSAFNFDCGLPRKFTSPSYEKLDGIQLIEMEQLAATTQLISAAATNEAPNSPATPSSPDTDKADKMPPLTKQFIVASEPLSPCEIVETVNYKLLTQDLQQLALNEEDFKGSDDELASAEVIEAINEPLISKPPVRSSAELIEAVNKPLISKPLVRSSSAACASTVAGSPLLTYARSKSLAAKANTLGGAVPIKLPTAEQLAELEEASKISAESLDRLTDIKSKFSPKESRKGPMLPEIAKLKHRPLSSSSICSTSSSSSSGSDQLNGKLATSYLASVESLADQSENELMDPHRGMSVFERSCLEIVDSERSYVEDLGQVIRGYLLDWKERACLSCNELQVLFSNIEEIYEFNSTLLKQLINSGMDPVKIAKCFINLRERFDVYTKYCTSYPEAISLLTKLLQATHTNALLTSTQKMLQQTLPLGSYLLKPVQRILKYHLLLDNLRKHCDVKEALQAYEIMRQVARNIDQVKRKLEQQSRVKELSGILDGWLGPELTVLGELHQEGLLVEHNKPRMVFLFSTMLIITKPKEDNRLQFKSYIHQNNLMLNEHLPGEPTSFYVIPYDEPRSQIKLTAKNRDQKRLWAQHIKGVILEKFDNIPVRAKELVYKLGDEEDRTPDKNTWKWSLHSTSSTPIYLERRNQYRRSEIRNRSKFKRKTVANSSSFDSFSEIAETTGKELPPSPAKGGKPLSRNNSIDDNMLPALQKLAAATKTKNKSDSNGPETNAPDSVDEGVERPDNNNKASSCVLREQRRSAYSAPKSPLFGGKMLKERSKSVPRNSFSMEDLDEESESLHGSTTNLDARKSKSSKSIEVKQYNHKTIPKRIATLKKQRTSKKETSTFYMDLDEFEDSTETLKIIESTENLVDKSKTVLRVDEGPANSPTALEERDQPLQPAEQAAEQPLTPAEKAKKDAQIILDLLKETKEFERMSKKPQKKRSFDHSVSTPTSPDIHSHPLLVDLPPRPPSRSPPPLEPDCDAADVERAQQQEEEEEPIYESLLRNVHVPYKFSPVLGRSKSTQYYTPREKKPVPAPRPESDYVTLVYSAEGALQKVGEDAVEREPQLHRFEMVREQPEQRESTGSSASSSSACTIKRDSQNTVIHLDCSSAGNISQLSVATSNCSTVTEAMHARPIPKNLMKRLLHGGSKSSPESISTSQNSLLPRARKSIDNMALSFGRSNKPPERRVSDVTEMCRQSILHRQGSEAVGERMAHVDYADPKTLFGVPASSEASLQRDSVFSLTSSSDSVCEHKHNGLAGSELAMDFAYEDNVEACLENDFRDSAIYSDDNEKRVEYEIGDCIKRPTSPPPPPPPPRNRNPTVPPKPTAIPRPKVAATAQRDVDAQAAGDEGAALPTSVVLCPPHLSAAASRSWVLKQIDNFSK